MNIALIFAGGTGSRMNTGALPKQFLNLHGKPILIYTLEQFDSHPEIDSIILVALAGWVEHCGELIDRFRLKKVRAVVPGGSSAFESQRNGLLKAGELYPGDSIVLIHDGVRPLIDAETISKNIEAVKLFGTSITVSPAVETIALRDEKGEVRQILDRTKVEMARAPQSFILKEILAAHMKAKEDGLNFIDSASLMKHYGYSLYTVPGRAENIKITTPNDFYTFRALVDARENSQVFGV